MKIGYARVSPKGQDLTGQRNALAALGVGPERIYVDDGLTGTSVLSACLAHRGVSAARGTLSA